MNMKVGLAVLSVLLAAGLLAACSPVRLLNALTPSYTFSLFAGIPYGSGERHVLDVYLPTRVLHHWPADASAGAPVVVFFYGGSWQSGERKDYLSWERRSRRGVLLPSYPTTGRIRRLPFPVSSTMRRRRWRGRASMQLRSAAIHVACF